MGVSKCVCFSAHPLIKTIKKCEKKAKSINNKLLTKIKENRLIISNSLGNLFLAQKERKSEIYTLIKLAGKIQHIKFFLFVTLNLK